jgi:hypothetical protein
MKTLAISVLFLIFLSLFAALSITKLGFYKTAMLFIIAAVLTALIAWAIKVLVEN